MITALAGIAFESPNVDAWRTFGPEVLGAELAPDGPGGAVRLRVDDAAHRIEIRPGDRDDLAALSWLAAPGTGAATFTDPFGFHHEIVTEVPQGPPFTAGRPMAGRFVTGDQGLGHVVLLVPDLAAAVDYYTTQLGLVPTDTVEAGATIRFFHCPGHAARHHTLALAGVPGAAGFHHLMLEVSSLDDVGTALDIVHERAIPLAMSLGRHTNDLMTSFYVRTPSGFEIEYGTGGRLVDDDTWIEATIDSQSLWGHRFPADGPLRPGIIRRVAQPA